MSITLPVDVGNDERVLLVPRHENSYAKVGTVAEVVERVRLPGGGRAVSLNGLHRGVVGAAENDTAGQLRVNVDEHPDPDTYDGRIRELEREYRAVTEEILEGRGDDGRVATLLRAISEPGVLADTVGYSPDFPFAHTLEVLATVDLRAPLELA